MHLTIFQLNIALICPQGLQHYNSVNKIPWHLVSLLYHIWLVSYISTFLFMKPIKMPAFGLIAFTCLVTGNLVERRRFIDRKI